MSNECNNSAEVNGGSRSLERVVMRPERTTPHAQKKCCEWLIKCMDFGWRKQDLDALENIWWEHHDGSGNLNPHNDQSAASRSPKA